MIGLFLKTVVMGMSCYPQANEFQAYAAVVHVVLVCMGVAL